MMMQPPIDSLPEAFKLPKQKNLIFEKLIDLYGKHQKNYSSLSYSRHPDQLRTNGAFKAGNLVLVPAAPLSNVVCDVKVTGCRLWVDVGQIDGH